MSATPPPDLIRRNPATEPYLTIKAAELSVHPGVLPLRGEAIAYSEKDFDSLSGSRFFWGPHAALRPGVYLLQFTGRIEGTLTLDFAHRGGNIRLTTVALTDFDKPVCLAITRIMEDFEIRGLKTRELQSLTLESIAVHRVYLAGKSSEPP